MTQSRVNAKGGRSADTCSDFQDMCQFGGREVRVGLDEENINVKPLWMR